MSIDRSVRGLMVLALLPLFGQTFAQAPISLPCKYGDKACAFAALRDHSAAKRSFWEQAFGEPLEKRMGAAPPELVEHLALANIRDAYPNNPAAATPAADFARDVRDAIAELPDRIVELLRDRLAGVYFVDDLGGTGFTVPIQDRAKKIVGGIVVLDRAVLSAHTANAWATWKENTPFKPDPGVRLSAQIATASQDNRKNAIQYILLHEFGHVLAGGGNWHPPWIFPPKKPESTASYPFFGLSWSVDWEAGRFITQFDGDFPRRRNVVYYLEPKLAADEIRDVYTSLEKTNFATLYAATHPWDDFAEAFVNYVHTMLMRRPFKISIYRDGKLEKEYGSCWEQPRCAEKRTLLEKMFGGT